jgi:hypothetical protein
MPRTKSSLPKKKRVNEWRSYQLVVTRRGPHRRSVYRVGVQSRGREWQVPGAPRGEGGCDGRGRLPRATAAADRRISFAAAPVHDVLGEPAASTFGEGSIAARGGAGCERRLRRRRRQWWSGGGDSFREREKVSDAGEEVRSVFFFSF